MNSFNLLPYNQILEEGQIEFSNLCSSYNKFKEDCYTSKVYFTVNKYIKKDKILNDIPIGRIFNAISCLTFYNITKTYTELPNRLVSKRCQLSRKVIKRLMVFGKNLGFWNIKFVSGKITYKINSSLLTTDSLLLAYENTTTANQIKSEYYCSNTGNEKVTWNKYQEQAQNKERRNLIMASIFAYEEIAQPSSFNLNGGNAPREDIKYVRVPLELIALILNISVEELVSYIRTMSKHVSWIKPHNKVYIDGIEEHYMNPDNYRNCPMVKYTKAEKEEGHPEVDLHTYILFKDIYPETKEYKYYLKHKKAYLNDIKEAIYLRYIEVQRLKNNYIQKYGTEDGFKSSIYYDNTLQYMDALDEKVAKNIELDAMCDGVISSYMYEYEAEDYVEIEKDIEDITAELNIKMEFQNYDNMDFTKEDKQLKKEIAANNWNMTQSKASQILEIFQSQGGLNIIDLDKIHGSIQNNFKPYFIDPKKISSKMAPFKLRGMLKKTIDSINLCDKSQLKSQIIQFLKIYEKINQQYIEFQKENNIDAITKYYQFFQIVGDGMYIGLYYQLEQSYKEYERIQKEKEERRPLKLFEMDLDMLSNLFIKGLERLYEKCTKKKFTKFNNRYQLDFSELKWQTVDKLQKALTDNKLLEECWLRYNCLFETPKYENAFEII